MSASIAAIVIVVGIAVLSTAGIIAINAIAARYERRDRARFMRSYYPSSVDAPGAWLATSDLPEPPAYERMW